MERRLLSSSKTAESVSGKKTSREFSNAVLPDITDKRSTGIGLYLCRQILDRLSHTIRVESRMGQGTKVIVGFAREDWGEGIQPSDTKNRNVTGM